MLKRLYKRAFDIRDGEITISFFMQLYIFLVITVLLIVKPTVNALFLSSLGADSLPYGYLLVAITAIVSSYFYNKALKKFSFRKVAILTLSFFSLLFVFLSVALSYDFLSDWILYLYYVLISLFAVVVTSQFWILANMVYNAREAKRLFGFIGAGAIAGGIFGGYLTTIISSNFGNRVTIFIAATLILCCIPILQRIWKLRLKTLSIYARRKKIHAESSPDRNAFQLILKSRHLLYLASIIGVGVVVAKLVDFQFSDFANKAIPDSDELASFLGFWFSSFNVAALLIQLFVTNRVLSYLGVTTTMLILPLGIALGSLLFLTFPELWVLILMKGLDGSFKQSINKAAVELSILPIPYAIKNQAKSFIDIVVDSVATGIAGFLLIFVIKGAQLATSFVTILILLFLFIWLLLIYKLRDAYFNSFRANLQNFLSKKEEGTKEKRKENSITSVREVLKTGSQEDILKLLQRLSANKLDPFKNDILALLDHPSDQVKSLVIEQLYYYRENTALDKVTTLVKESTDEQLILNGLQYLLHHTKIDDNQIFKSYLDHSNKQIANAALLCLAQDAKSNNVLAERFNLSQRLKDKIAFLSTPEGLEEVLETTVLLEAVAYAKIKTYYYFISIHFSNTNEDVLRQAIRAAGITSDLSFIGHLLSFLEDKQFRKDAITSLVQYGPEINKTILKLEREEVLSNEIKRHLPKVVASFSSQDSIKILYDFLSSKDVDTREHAANSLKKLSNKNPELRVSKRRIVQIILKESTFYRRTSEAIALFKNLLANEQTESVQDEDRMDLLVTRESIIALLEEQLEKSLKTIFVLLSLNYNKEDIETAYFGLLSNDEEAHVNAIEFLDNLLHIKLKSRILPLLETNLIEGEPNPMMAHNSSNNTEFTTIKGLLKYRGKRMKLAMLHLIELKHDKNYLPLVRPLAKHKDPLINKLSHAILASYKGTLKS